MDHTIDGAFDAYWKALLEKDSKLAAYPESYRLALKEAFTQGYSVGSTDRSILHEVHKEMDKENRSN